MAQSATVQDRIRKFETLDDATRGLRVSGRGSRPSYPPAPRVMRRPVFTATTPPAHTKNLMEEPISPSAAPCAIMKPTIPYVPRKPRIKSPSPSPPNLGCTSSLVDLKDWVVEDGPKSPMSSSQATVTGRRLVDAPPLPPRSWSQSSATSSTVSLRSCSSSRAPPSAISPNSTNSLGVEHTYPPPSYNPSRNVRQGRGHMHVSSTSSFQSVSLSDGDADSIKPMLNVATRSVDQEEAACEGDRDSQDDTHSFEAIYSIGLSSPTMSSTHEWVKDFASPSVLHEPLRRPSRRISHGGLMSSPNHSRSYDPLTAQLPHSSRPSTRIRRIPPPPPSRSTKPPLIHVSSRASVMSSGTSASDQSSVFSTSTTTTAHTSIGSYVQLSRPTPVPRIVRERYESLFFANVNAQRRVTMNTSSQKMNNALSPIAASSASPTISRKGWRGLSVDLIPAQEGTLLAAALNTGTDDDANNNRLEGRVVRQIWQKSGLHIEKLSDIWNECALPSEGSLDKDTFIKGMWRVDEELRRAQTSRNSGHPRLNKRASDLLQ